MKRSEFVKLVNDISSNESARFNKEIAEALTKQDTNGIAEVVAMLVVELPSLAAKIAATIIEKADLIQFDPESTD